MYYLDLFLI